MDHVAIMKKSWGLIPKILTGEKDIESRWYQTRRAPWNSIQKGERVFFKNAGEKIIAQARVSRVLQFEIQTNSEAQHLVNKYGKRICLVQTNIRLWGKLPHYGILIFLKDAKKVEPFPIDKKGFGCSAAWITVKHIRDIQI